MERWFVVIGAVMGFLGVALGAFGAHGLAAYFEANPGLEATFETAVRYQMYHAVALFAVAWAMTRWPGSALAWAGILMIVGVIIFSGSLYLLVLTNIRWLGAITPIGGVAMLTGWALLAFRAWRG